MAAGASHDRPRTPIRAHPRSRPSFSVVADFGPTRGEAGRDPLPTRQPQGHALQPTPHAGLSNPASCKIRLYLRFGLYRTGLGSTLQSSQNGVSHNRVAFFHHFECVNPTCPVGCRLKPRRLRGRPGFTRQPENSKRAHSKAPALQNTTKIPRKDPPRERQERKKIVARVGNLGPPTLQGLPTLRGHTVVKPLKTLITDKNGRN